MIPMKNKKIVCDQCLDTEVGSMQSANSKNDDHESEVKRHRLGKQKTKQNGKLHKLFRTYHSSLNGQNSKTTIIPQPTQKFCFLQQALRKLLHQLLGSLAL